MMSKTTDFEVELAKAIGNFIEKYWNNSQRVERYDCEHFVLEIKGVYQVQINEASLEEVKGDSNLWTFNGTALILLTDKSNVDVNCKNAFTGSAYVHFQPNGGNTNDLLPMVDRVVITKVIKNDTTQTAE